MTLEELIKHTNLGLSKDKLKLSPEGEKAFAEKFKKKEDQGGFANYWKEVKFEDVPR